MAWSRDGADGPGWYFHSTNAIAGNGGPVLVSPTGHLGARTGLLMSDTPDPKDERQVVSGLERAMLKDMGSALRESGDDHQADLVGLYFAIFGRAPDSAGLAYWQARLEAGMALGDIAQAFFAQPEAQAVFGGDLVGKVYHHVLGRVPDPAGFAYWTAALASGQYEGEFVLAIIEGAQGADAVHLQHALDEYALAQVEIVGTGP